MDVLVLRVSKYSGVVADYGPFQNEEEANRILIQKGWTRTGRRYFELHKVFLYEGHLVPAFNLLPVDELPKKETWCQLISRFP